MLQNLFFPNYDTKMQLMYPIDFDYLNIQQTHKGSSKYGALKIQIFSFI